MQPVDVLTDPGVATVALDPLRSRMLVLLAAQARSAATLAPLVGISRQRARYHLKALADHGLATEVDQRQHGGITERLFRASAAAYVVSPSAMGEAGVDPAHVDDRLSSAYQVALAARVVREVGDLAGAAAESGRPLPTWSIDAEIHFRSADDRAAFAAELERSVLALVARYHDETVEGARPHRLVVLAHPTPKEPTT